MAIWTGVQFVVCDQVSWFQAVIYETCPQMSELFQEHFLVLFLNIDFLLNATPPPYNRNDQFLANVKYMLLEQASGGEDFS